MNTARSRQLTSALAGRAIRSVEVLTEEGYEIIRLTTDRGEVVAITGVKLDFAPSGDEDPSD